MKVLQVGKFYFPQTGGIETALRALCDELRKSVDLQVLAANTTRETIREVVSGVPVTRVASWGTIASTSICPSFAKAMTGFHADIIHLHEPNPLATLSFLRARPEGKLVVTLHSEVIRQRLSGRLYRPFVRKLLRVAEKIIVGTPHHLHCLPILSPVREKCVVIPFGIDADRFRPQEKNLDPVREIRAKFGERIVLFVGRLVYYKGVEHLITAMKWIEGTLLIIGSGPLERKLRRLARELGVEGRVVFIGEIGQEALLSYYHACDLLVLPSTHRSEMFGIVQVEAMACGKPVVSSDLPTGVSWVNQNEITGLLVPPGDALALAEAVTRLLNDPTLREHLGRNARERVEREFTKQKMAARTLELYRGILRGESPQPD